MITNHITIEDIQALRFTTTDNLMNFLDTYPAPEAEIRPCKQVRQIGHRRDRRLESANLRTRVGRI